MRRLTIVLGAFGAGLLATALLWALIAPGQLVKYPSDLDKTAIAKGTVTLYFDPATGNPDATAQTLPLTIRRHLKVVASTGSQATVQETSTEQIGAAAPQKLLQRYVIDRTSLKNLTDHAAYAYAPANLTDRSPNYSINLPFSTGDGPYPLWKNETGSAYQFQRAGKDIARDGLTLTPMSGSLANMPASSGYVAALGLRAQTTIADLAPQLKAQGVDPAALTKQLLPALSAADRAAVTAALAKPIPIKYLVSVDTRLLVEPTTGAIVSLDRIDQTMSGQPDLSRFATLAALLAKPQYTSTPVAQGTLTALKALPTGPTRLLHMRYGQTTASVADMAAYAQDKADGIRLVKTAIPLGLTILGVASLLGAAAAYGLRRPARASA